MGLINWLKGLFGAKECDHKNNYRERRWCEDGVPNFVRVCDDCGWTDSGPVMGDCEGWEKSIEVTNGVKTEEPL